MEVIPKPTEPTLKTDKDGDYVTYTDEQHVIEGRDGYVVDAYLVTYQNGYAIARDKFTSDVYKEKADTIYTGTEERTGGF